MTRGTKTAIVAVAAVVAVLLLSLCGVITFFSENPPTAAGASLYPPLDYLQFTNPANRASYADYCARMLAFSDSYAKVCEPFDAKVANALGNLPAHLPDDIRDTIARTATLRREVLAYLRRQNTTPFIDTVPSATAANIAIPKLLFLVNACKLSGLEIVDHQRNGRPVQARQQVDELLAAAESLSGRGLLIQELVSIEMIKIFARTVGEMYPLGGSLPPDRELLTLLERCEVLDGSMRAVLVPALAGEALEMAVSLEEYRTKNYGPFYDHDRLLRRLHNENARLAFLSTLDLWTITGQLGEPPEKRVGAWERYALPVNESVFLMAYAKLGSLLIKKEAARGTLRLLRLQLHLAMYLRRHGKLPGTLAELYADCHIAPIINPLTGREYPYPVILGGDRVDLSFDDGKTLTQQLLSN